MSTARLEKLLVNAVATDLISESSPPALEGAITGFLTEELVRLVQVASLSVARPPQRQAAGQSVGAA